MHESVVIITSLSTVAPQTVHTVVVGTGHLNYSVCSTVKSSVFSRLTRHEECIWDGASIKSVSSFELAFMNLEREPAIKERKLPLHNSPLNYSFEVCRFISVVHESPYKSREN